MTPTLNMTSTHKFPPQLTVWQLPNAVNAHAAVSGTAEIPNAVANALTAVREQQPAVNAYLNVKNIKVGNE